MGILESLTSLAMIFVMIIPGLILGRKKMISEDQSLGLTTVVTTLTWPCLVISAMQIPFSYEILKNSGYAAIIMSIMFVIAFLMSMVIQRFTKLERHHKYLFTFMLMFSNTGFMGVPIMNAVYGGDATFYAAILEMVSNVFLFTIGISFIQISAGKKFSMHPKELLSPALIGVITGFLLFMFNITLPGFLGKSIEIVGSATTPLTMLIIGLNIGRMHVKDIFNDNIVYLISFCKLLVIPAISYVILFVILGDSSLIAKVAVTDFAMPVAMCTAIFAQQYRADYQFASKGVFVCTLFSIITIPLFTILVNL